MDMDTKDKLDEREMKVLRQIAGEIVEDAPKGIDHGAITSYLAMKGHIRGSSLVGWEPTAQGWAELKRPLLDKAEKMISDIQPISGNPREIAEKIIDMVRAEDAPHVPRNLFRERRGKQTR